MLPFTLPFVSSHRVTENNNNAIDSGAVYVFVRQGTNWIQQAQLKASNPGVDDGFGWPGGVAVSGDTVVVGAQSEDSNATGVNGNQNNNSAQDTGAAYIFVRNGTNWTQQAYLKASNPGAGVFLTAGLFGGSVGVSGDTVVISSGLEDSNATGVNGDQSNNSATDSGAAYVFTGLGLGTRLAIVPNGGSGYVVRFNGAPDLTYRLQRASSVIGPWNTIDTQTAPASGLIEYPETNPLPGAAFYRTVTP